MERKKVYRLMLGVFLVTALVFAYLFYNRGELELPTGLQGRVDSSSPPRFSQVFYGGFGPDSLQKPMDIAISGQFIYVSDTNNKRVQVFDLAGSPLFKFGTEGEGPGQFKFPYGIAGDRQGQIYVADLYNGCISIHDSRGKFLRYFAEKQPQEKVIEAPGSIRIIRDRVYVPDIKKCQVLVFDLSGKLLLTVGKLGTGPGELRAPNAVTADQEGNIYVVDTGNQRVQVFNPQGQFLRQFQGSGLVNPRGIGIDSRGVIYVVSNLTHQIHAFDQKGKQLYVFGSNGEGLEQFSLPNGLLVDENNRIYITDTMNQRIAVYQ